MKGMTMMVVTAVAMSLACGEATPGDVAGPAEAKGKPDLNTAQTCEAFPAGAYYTGLVALCASTADANTVFLSMNADRDRSGLIAKLNRAGQKCSEDGDVFAAVGKLADYRDQVLTLRSSGKLSEPAGVDLAGDAQVLIEAFDPSLTANPLTCPSGDPAS